MLPASVSLRRRFALVTLPHEAYYSLDAILRTLARLLVTHKRLLEWNPSSDQEQPSRTDLAVAHFAPCGLPPLLAVGTGHLPWRRSIRPR